MHLVSIVVPMYKVERYLERCLDSILAQTLSDFELILVDDGSPDSSGQMADEYALKDPRIKVVHKKNGGLSSARNAGTRLATGRYVGYIDSDDWVEPSMFERLLHTAELFSVDIVMFDYTRKARLSERIHTECIDSGLYDREKIINNLFPSLIIREDISYGPVLSAWSCFYRLDFLRAHRLEFDETVLFSEDSLFNSIAIEKTGSFYYIKESFYNYFHNEDSISTVYKNEKWCNTKLLNDKIRDYFQPIAYFDFQDQIKRHMVYFACNCLSQVCRCDKSKEFKSSEIRKIISDPRLTDAITGLTFPLNTLKFKFVLWLMKKQWSSVYSLLLCD